MNRRILPQSVAPSKRKTDAITANASALAANVRTRNLLTLGALVTLASAFAGGLSFYQSCKSWRRREQMRIRAESAIIETSLGPVEYQITGEGPVVIYAHGTPGGYDQGVAFADFLGHERCTFIVPSRPGYLRTPLTSGRSPAAQADLYTALLDALGIQQAAIIGFSGGGPSALEFALRHPQRCRSLVMIGGIVQRNGKHARLRVQPFWKRLASQVIDYLLISDPFLYFILPFARLMPAGRAVAGMLCSGALYPLRKAGYENDLAQFATLPRIPLEKIAAPTLIVHGTTDSEVPFEDARLLASKLPHVTLLAIEGGDHAAFYTSARTVLPIVRDFLSPS